MASPFRRLLLPLVLTSAIAASSACSDDPATTAGGGGPSDGGASSKEDGGANRNEGEDDAETDNDSGRSDAEPGDQDAGACGPIVTTPGETCIGFGAKAETCDPACGQPYGYVCFDGAPPGFAGCRKASESPLGQTYCCPKNECVAQPDQDQMCNGVTGKPHRFQCPPDGNGGNVAPPAGCEEKDSGGSEVEKYYCCP